MKKLAIIITHPIQYYAPVFKQLSSRGKLELQVFYTWGEDSLKEKYDPGFKKVINWDIPLLDGYKYKFLKNTSAKPGSGSFNGIINPDAIIEIEEFKPDAILVYGWAYKSHLSIIRYFHKRVPVWFRGDSNLLDVKLGWKSVLRGALLTWIYKHVDRAFFVGSANRDYFIRYGLNKNQLVFAPHAIDNQRFSIVKSKDADDFRKALGLLHNEFLILFAGKLEPKKNPELLLNAFKELNKPNVHLLFVGNGVLEADLKMKVESLKIANVHFLDFQNQTRMPIIYQSCDVFCLPSQGPGETWGLVINEAMASSKPIIASNKVGCSADLVIDGSNGFTFDSNNKAQLIKLLDKVTTSKEYNQNMGIKSLELIHQWSFDEQVKVFEKEIENLDETK